MDEENPNAFDFLNWAPNQTLPRRSTPVMTYDSERRLPWKGNTVPNIKDTDPSRKRPQLGIALKCKTFDLTDDSQKEEFERLGSKVLTRQIKKLTQLTAIERWRDDEGHMKVYLEWVEFYLFEPEETE